MAPSGRLPRTGRMRRASAECLRRRRTARRLGRRCGRQSIPVRETDPLDPPSEVSRPRKHLPGRDPSPDTNLYGVSAGSAQSSVTGQDWALQGFGECDVCGVVGAEIVAEGVGA